MTEEYIVGEMVINKDTGFRAPINDAYSFRCLVDFMGSTIINLPLLITPSSIGAVQSDNHRTIFHVMNIDTDKLPEFYINPEIEYVEMCVNMRQFRSKIKNAQKRTVTLTLFNNMKNLQNFYAIIVVPNQKSNGTIIIDTVRCETQPVYEFPKYVNDKGIKLSPNLVLQVTDLSRVFNHVSNSKCNYAEFQCYQKGIIIKGMNDGKLTCIQTLGRVANPFNVGEETAVSMNGQQLCTYCIPTINIKPFYKIGNISPQSATLQIYYHPNKPLKIIFPIGTSGQHEVFLIDVDPKTMKPR